MPTTPTHRQLGVLRMPDHGHNKKQLSPVHVLAPRRMLGWQRMSLRHPNPRSVVDTTISSCPRSEANSGRGGRLRATAFHLQPTVMCIPRITVHPNISDPTSLECSSNYRFWDTFQPLYPFVFPCILASYPHTYLILLSGGVILYPSTQRRGYPPFGTVTSSVVI
jgi:hypothetical protein